MSKPEDVVTEFSIEKIRDEVRKQTAQRCAKIALELFPYRTGWKNHRNGAMAVAEAIEEEFGL